MSVQKMELNSKEVLQIYSVFILEWGNQWLIRLVIFVPTWYWRKDNSLKLISHTSTLHVKHTHKTNLQAWCWQQQDVCPVCQEEQGWFSLLRRVKDHLSLVNWQQVRCPPVIIIREERLVSAKDTVDHRTPLQTIPGALLCLILF